MTGDLVDDTIVAALAPVAAMVAADGYLLEVARAVEGTVAVSVVATAEACAECLVPPAVFAGFVHQHLASAGLDIAPEDVLVAYPETGRSANGIPSS